ncbi:MAG TPA: 2-C-methyl-D-erythritol 2,4-cyclodiphosphate synthase [Gemmatimonadales bacterium]|nr:2-C-methyl-D-erythritol 2,4-cyclodiphosphate synthase [Gemmatimonadales bacterium]
MHIGIGYDSHKFAFGRPLVLGGVTIPHTHGLVGHSDADAVTHALIDALLGAAGAGDIGTRFPDTDPQWKGADSIRMLNQVYLELVETGMSFVHADIVVITEQPKLAGYIDQMREKLAGALVAGHSSVSVKAKTNEGMGFIGRGEGIAAIAVVLLE